MNLIFIVMFYIWCSCSSLLTAPKENILEQHLAECALKISSTYFDPNFPVVVHTPSTFYPPGHRNYKYGDKLIQELQAQFYSPIIVLGNRNNRNCTWQIEVQKPGSIIIVVPPTYTAQDFDYIFHTYRTIGHCAFNPTANIIIVTSQAIGAIIYDKPYPHFLLSISFKFGYLDIIVLEPKSMRTGNGTKIIRIFGFRINDQRKICSQELNKIKHVETWATEEKKFFLNSSVFPLQGKLNLKKCYLKVAVLGTFPYSIPFTNSTLGFFGPFEWFLYCITKLLNVKISIVKDYNVADIVFPSLYDPLNIKIWHKLTYPYFRQDITWYVPLGREIPRWQSLVRAFNPLLWCLILLTTALGTLTMWLLQKSEGHSTAPSVGGILAALSSAFLTFLGVAVTERYKGFVAVLFFMLWLYYCLIISTAYQSALFGLLVHPGHSPPIQTFKELEESGLIMERTYSVTNATAGIWWKQMQYKMCNGSTIECLKKVSADRTHALSDSTWIGKLFAGQCRDKRGHSQLEYLKEFTITVLYCVLVKRFFSFLVPVFNNVIHTFVASGIFVFKIDLVVTEWLLWNRNLDDQIESVMTVSLHELQGEFYLLLIGFLLASLVLAMEFLVHFIGVRFSITSISSLLDRLRLRQRHDKQNSKV
ncbi:Ionotropic receptor 295 [Blattella germanica]|nr:Ionotropic receptor 295 [Blattella germanica]